VAGAFLLPGLGFVGPALAQEPQATVVELQFKERKEDSNYWYGFGLDKDGKVVRSFATASGKWTLQVVNDKLRADTNGDGVIDDKDAPACEANNEQEAVRVKVPVRFGEKTVDYPLCVRIQKSDNQRFLIVGSAAMLEGKFGQHVIRIYDSDLDGRLGTPGDNVAIELPQSKDRGGLNSLPWSRTMMFDGKLHEVELVNKGTALKLAPYTGPIAEVQLEFTQPVKNERAILQEAGNVQLGQCSSRAMSVFVPGKYRIYNLNFQLGEGAGAVYLNASQAYNTAPLELKAGKNVIKVGPPFKMEFTAARNGEMLESTQASITGQAGELYRPSVQEDRGDIFAAYIRLGEKEQKLTTLGFG
jgi:virulence-associated protein VagC